MLKCFLLRASRHGGQENTEIMSESNDTKQLPGDKVPVPVKAKHPMRFGIFGDLHTIPELKKIIAAKPEPMPASLKQFIADELDKMTSNAAQVDLHIVDHGNGDVSGSFHIKAIKLGEMLKS
jgi:hypothetical protein